VVITADCDDDDDDDDDDSSSSRSSTHLRSSEAAFKQGNTSLSPHCS